MKVNQDRDENLLLTIASMGGSGTFGASNFKSMSKSILTKEYRFIQTNWGIMRQNL